MSCAILAMVGRCCISTVHLLHDLSGPPALAEFARRGLRVRNPELTFAVRIIRFPACLAALRSLLSLARGSTLHYENMPRPAVYVSSTWDRGARASFT